MGRHVPKFYRVEYRPQQRRSYVIVAEPINGGPSTTMSMNENDAYQIHRQLRDLLQDKETK